METTPGKRLADLRRRKADELGRRLTQREVAEAIGVSRETYAAWEADLQAPAGENLLKAARYYGVEPGEIMYGGERSRVAEARAGYGITMDQAEVDRRLRDILSDAKLSPREKSELLLDVALVLRADAMRARDQAALIEARLAERRQIDMSGRGAPPYPGKLTPVERPSEKRGERAAG